jgi:BlaI family transcriptional regulator, penicillinase repressor
MPSRPSLSNSELQIWRVVGELGSARVRDVAQALPADRGLDFFTVQTYLRRLKTKGYLKTRRQGRADVYYPAIKPANVIRQVTAEFLHRTFGGDAMPLMQQLIQDHGLSDQDVDQLQATLDEFKRRRKS